MKSFSLRKGIIFSGVSFLFSIVAVCIINYILQILVVFLDIITRLSSSTAFVIVLWIVTGVFAVVFAFSWVEAYTGKGNISYKLTGNTVMIISTVAMVMAIVLLLKGEFNHNPSEFSLLLSNGYIFLSFFAGSATMAAIMRNLD